jgi:amiloride-sensitive sodium channel
MKVFSYIAGESSIHGVKFLADTKVNKVVRVLWCCVLILSFFGLFVYVRSCFIKLNDEPEISVRVKLKPMSEIPFPAVTMCDSVFARDNLANYVNFFFNIQLNVSVEMAVSEQNYFASNLQACAPYAAVNSQALANRTEFDVVKLLNESSFTTDELFGMCLFRRHFVIKCDKIFNRIFTDFGFCHSTNMQGYNTIFNKGVLHEDFDCYKRRRNVYNWIPLPKDLLINDDNETIEWTLDDGYNVKGDDSFIIPKRASKQNFLLFASFVDNLDMKNVCPEFGQTFRILFHLPNEIPTIFHIDQSVAFNQRKTMYLTAKSYRGDESLKRFAPDKRRCYFQGERQLKFFKSYTKQHCDLECITNYTLDICGCVKFSMPRTQDTKVCDVDQGICYHKAMMIWPNNNTYYDDSKTACDCYPTCNDIAYKVTYEHFAELRAGNHLKHLKPGKNGLWSVLGIVFSSHQVEEYEQYASYTIQTCKSPFNV